MKYRPFAQTGVSLPIIGHGTWQLENDDRAQAIAAIQVAIDCGMTHIDTAELYGYGEVEDLVGEAIRGRRDEVYLVSKVMPDNASATGTLAACERSLRHLGTDHLDLYLLHWPGRHPLEDTIAAFEKLREAGKIRDYGVSNFDENELDEAVRIAGPGRIVCNQVLYHLEERAIERRLIPACERHGVAVVAYSPFGSGRFPSKASKGGRVLAEIAASHHATPYQVALAFLVRMENVFTIPKSARPEHVRDNAAAAELTLSDEECRRLDAAFPLGPDQPGIPTL